MMCNPTEIKTTIQLTHPQVSEQSKTVTVWYIPDDNGLPFHTTGYAFEAQQWAANGHKVIAIQSSQPVPSLESNLMEVLQETIDSAEIMMDWCVKNIKKWHFHQYDYLFRSVARAKKVLDAAIAAAPQTKEGEA